MSEGWQDDQAAGTEQQRRQRVRGSNCVQGLEATVRTWAHLLCMTHKAIGEIYFFPFG